MSNFVIIESPYAGDVETNLRYVRACMADCFRRGEIPFASHALYTQPGVLDDTIPEERNRGIKAGFEVAKALPGAKRVFCLDRGWSGGMSQGDAHRMSIGQAAESRYLPEWPL